MADQLRAKPAGSGTVSSTVQSAPCPFTVENEPVYPSVERELLDALRGTEPFNTTREDEQIDPTTETGSAILMSEPTRASDEPAKAFRELEKMYRRKKRAGTSTTKEDIEFMMAQNAEQSRLRKEQADREYDHVSVSAEGDDNDGDGLFVSQEQPVLCQEETIEPPTEQASNSNKKRRRVGGALEEEASQGATQTQMQTKKRRGRPKKQQIGPNMTNIGSLMGTNIFADTAATANLPVAPAVVAMA